MQGYQMRIIATLLYASVATLIIPGLVYLVRWMSSRKACDGCKKTGIGKVLAFSACLIISVWFLRYAVGYFTIVSAKDHVATLTCWEEIFNSLVHALQTFSMDEDYTAYILDGKEMVGAVFGEDTWWQSAYGIYASLLNFVSPVAGGAIVFEILASILPKVRLRLTYLAFWRKKYFFSELNAASLALAKDICREMKNQWPVLIFTDAYTDDGSEKDHERMLEAKQYGAICLRDDLAHVEKPLFGKREYYLMDENEFGNLQTLMDLTQAQHVKALKKANVYLFVQSDAYVQVEMQVNQKLKQLQQEEVLKAEACPNIIPVNGYRNLVNNLFMDVPLYEPLVGRADTTKLQITVFGNGSIGTEAFSSIYWLGQMLGTGKNGQGFGPTPCELTVNVVSKDTPEEFWSKIDYINPEIRQTVAILEGETVKMPEDILCCDRQGNRNPPYCNVRYISADIKFGGFLDGQTEDARRVLQSDYFIVALGSDADNISVAQKLRCCIGKMHLEAAPEEVPGNAVVAYAVFDPGLAQVLNGQKRHQLRSKDRTDLYMHAFGSLEQVYSCDNVYMSKSALQAEETGNAYLKNQLKESHIKDNQKRAGGAENGNYNYWADMARASHIKYKVFSTGWLRHSLFSYYGDEIKVYAFTTPQKEVCYEMLPQDCPDPDLVISADEYHKQYTRQYCKRYKAAAVCNRIGVDNRVLAADLEQKKHVIAWLEHRRWNAFTRTMGYQHTPAKNVFAVKDSQKDMPLKLHACLVEAGPFERPYILARFDRSGKVDLPSTLISDTEGMHDHLDAVSWERWEHAQRKAEEGRKKGRQVRLRKTDDFKMYDYFRYEFDDYLTLDDVCYRLSLDPDVILANCKKGIYHGAEYFRMDDTWRIPYRYFKAELKKKYHLLDPEKPEEAALIRRTWEEWLTGYFVLNGDYYVNKDQLEELLAGGGRVCTNQSPLTPAT